MTARAYGFALALVLLAPSDTPAVIDEADRAVHVINVDQIKLDVFALAILDVRPQEDYLSGHIPAARPLDVEALARLVLAPSGPDHAALLRLLHRTPARADHPLIVYDTASRRRQDGLAAWLLAYAGFPAVHILDGSFSAWLRRKNLGVYEGHPIPTPRMSLRPEDLHPRPHLRVDPDALESGLPEGSVLLDILPFVYAGDDSPPPTGPGRVRVSELVDQQGDFLFPYHLEELLASRDVDHEARLVLRGDTLGAAFAWVAFTVNGFDAALVEPLRRPTPPSSQP